MTAPAADDVEMTADRLRELVGRLRRRLALETPPEQPTQSEASVLSHLDRVGSASQTQIARAQGMQPQSLGSLIAELERRGLVARQRDPGDRRAFTVALTSQGTAAVAEFRAARNAWLAGAMLRHLDVEERTTLTRAVALIERLLEKG